MKSNLIEFFKKYEWVYSQGKVPNIFTLLLSGYNGNYHCVAEIDDQQRRFVFISFLGLKCPEEKMKDMAELLTRINSNLSYGNFEMNFPSGDVKFRTGTYFEDTELTEKAINNVVFRNISTIDISVQPLSKFMLGQASITEVYDELYPVSLPQNATESENKELPDLEKTI